MVKKQYLLLIIAAVIGISAQDNELGNVALDDDDSVSLMEPDVNGWIYPSPKAQDAPINISLSNFPFVAMNPAVLRENKEHMHDYDHGLQHALWFLKKKADRYALNDTLFSVVKKTIAVPGGNDKHDYMSLARYFWPNESQPHGMPYVRHDGQVNPEIEKVPDYQMFRSLVKHVQYLALGYHYFDNETYAEKATSRIHDWFINPKTRMNPHLQYASLVRGYETGRAKGVIDFHVVPDLLDSMAILQYSHSWKPEMTRHIRFWFAQYIEWLTKSPNGIFESQSYNNHGTHYDIQQAAIYRFLNKTDLAKQVVANASAARIAQQILTSGEQYLETARPFSWFYSVFNLKAMFRLAAIGKPLGVDLFKYHTVDNKGIKQALDFLIPYSLKEASWHFSNSGGFEATADLVEILEMAYAVYGNDTYMAIASHLATLHNRPYNITRLTMSWTDMGDQSAQAQEGFVRSQGDTAEQSLLILGVSLVATLCMHLLIT